MHSSDRSRAGRTRLRRLLACLATITLLSVGSTVLTSSPVFAHKSSNGMPSATYNVRPYSFDRWPYHGRVDAAITNWNGHSKVGVGKSSSANSYIEVKWFQDTWYGLYTKFWRIFKGHYMRIQLNYRTIERDASNTANFVQSVMAHELGHSLSLAHNSVTSIMNQSRNRNTLYTRQTHDNNDVTSYY